MTGNDRLRLGLLVFGLAGLFLTPFQFSELGMVQSVLFIALSICCLVLAIMIKGETST